MRKCSVHFFTRKHFKITHIREFLITCGTIKTSKGKVRGDTPLKFYKMIVVLLWQCNLDSERKD